MTSVRNVVARYKKARQIPMGSWDGVTHFWPEVPGFTLHPEKSDRFGDFYEAEYQDTTVRDVNLVGSIVHFAYRGHAPDPGTYSADVQGQSVKGTWTSESEIPGILESISRQTEEAAKDIEKSLLSIGGPSWEINYDGMMLNAEFKNTDRYSDAHMSVTFDFVTDALNGDPQEAEIYFSSGSDYQGAFGQRRTKKCYRSIADMKNIMTFAERLWAKYSQEYSQK